MSPPSFLQFQFHIATLVPSAGGSLGLRDGRAEAKYNCHVRVKSISQNMITFNEQQMLKGQEVGFMIRLQAAFDQESGDQDSDKGCTVINSVDLGEVTLLPFVFPNELMLANTQTLVNFLKNPNLRICFIDFRDREEAGEKVRNIDMRERHQSMLGFHHQAPIKYPASVSWI